MTKQPKELPPSENSMVLSAALQRRAVGTLGMLLPIIVLTFNDFTHEASISSYYYTDSRNFFVGILWVLGFFLIFYRGYEIRDFILTFVAGVAAILTALWPCSPTQTGLSDAELLRGNIHLIFAAVFLICLDILITFMFTRTAKKGKETPQKLKRNLVYYVCGSLMALSLIALLIFHLTKDKEVLITSSWPVYCLETVAVFSFGFAWLVKGDTLWRDK